MITKFRSSILSQSIQLHRANRLVPQQLTLQNQHQYKLLVKFQSMHLNLPQTMLTILMHTVIHKPIHIIPQAIHMTLEHPLHMVRGDPIYMIPELLKHYFQEWFKHLAIILLFIPRKLSPRLRSLHLAHWKKDNLRLVPVQTSQNLVQLNRLKLWRLKDRSHKNLCSQNKFSKPNQLIIKIQERPFLLILYLLRYDRVASANIASPFLSVPRSASEDMAATVVAAAAAKRAAMTAITMLVSSVIMVV